MMLLPDNTQAEIQSFVDTIMQSAEPENRRIRTGLLAIVLVLIGFAAGYMTGQQPDIRDQFVIDEHKVLEFIQTQKAQVQPVNLPVIPDIEVTFKPV